MIDMEAIHFSFASLERSDGRVTSDRNPRSGRRGERRDFRRAHHGMGPRQAHGACTFEYPAAEARKLLDELIAEDDLLTRALALQRPDSLEVIEKRANDGRLTASTIEASRRGVHCRRGWAREGLVSNRYFAWHA
jgi:hypothetical protein